MATVILYQNCGCFIPNPDGLHPITEQWRDDMNKCFMYPSTCEVEAQDKMIRAVLAQSGSWEQLTVQLTEDTPTIIIPELIGMEIKKVLFMDNSAYQTEFNAMPISFDDTTGEIGLPGYSGSTINIEYRQKIN